MSREKYFTIKYTFFRQNVSKLFITKYVFSKLATQYYIQLEHKIMPFVEQRKIVIFKGGLVFQIYNVCNVKNIVYQF
jgi:hypothetical protein